MFSMVRLILNRVMCKSLRYEERFVLLTDVQIGRRRALREVFSSQHSDSFMAPKVLTIALGHVHRMGP